MDYTEQMFITQRNWEKYKRSISPEEREINLHRLIQKWKEQDKQTAENTEEGKTTYKAFGDIIDGILESYSRVMDTMNDRIGEALREVYPDDLMVEVTRTHDTGEVCISYEFHILREGWGKELVDALKTPEKAKNCSPVLQNIIKSAQEIGDWICVGDGEISRFGDEIMKGG